MPVRKLNDAVPQNLKECHLRSTAMRTRDSGLRRKLYRAQLSDGHLEALLRYKNCGVDLSVTYKYVLSPLYDVLINFVPLCAAPNMITAIGFLLALGGHLVVMMHAPSMQEDVPQWACLVAALGLLLYMILDNLDGRQARRTSSSSPLGHLFDHACDALNVTLSVSALCASLRVGPRRALVTICASQLTLVAAGLEEYITGAMTLRALNGANEGLLTIVALQLYIGIYGVANLQSIARIAMRIQLVASILSITASFAACTRIDTTPKPGIARMLFAPVSYIASYSAWALLSPSSYTRHSRVSSWCSAFFIFDIVSRTIVAHLVNDHTMFPVAPLTLMCITIPPLLCVLAPHSTAFIPPLALFICMTLALWRALCVIHQLCHFLNIHCFRLPPLPSARVHNAHVQQQRRRQVADKEKNEKS